MVKKDSNVLREVAGNLVKINLEPELSIIKDAMNKEDLDVSDIGNYIGPPFRYLGGVTAYVVVKASITKSIPEETPFLYNCALIGGILEGQLTFVYEAVKNRFRRHKKEEFSVEENQREIDELERRLTQMDNETAIFQFSHGQTSEAMNTVYFKNIKKP